jgi:hypothetical protein
MITTEALITLLRTGNPKLSIHRTPEPPTIFLTGWLDTSLLAESLNLLVLNPDVDTAQIVPFLQAVSCGDHDEQ